MQSVLADLGDQVLQWFELLFVDKFELLDKIVVVLEQGVGMSLSLKHREAVKMMNIDVHKHPK